MRRPLRALLVEKSFYDAELVLAELRRGGYDPVHVRVEGLRGMAQALDEQIWEVVICCQSLPSFDAVAALRVVSERGLDIPFIIVSGDVEDDRAIAAMRAGAHDYVMKHNLTRLAPAIERELREKQVRVARRAAEDELREKEARLAAIISNIPGMVFLFEERPGRRHRFSYVSEGSQALLGVSPKELMHNERLFCDLVVPEDLDSFWRCMRASAAELRPANWEGRIRLPREDSSKWINLRSIPRKLGESGVQWVGIMANITNSKLAEQEIMQSRQRLSELSSHLEQVKEQERTRIAREVHDDIGGYLTAIKIDLLWLAARAGGGKGVKEKILAMESLLDQTMEISSRIGRDLRPGILDLGLLAAIEWQAEEFERRMEIPCHVECTDRNISLDAGLATTLFSIFRETLTNITKHAQATRVQVTLGHTPHQIELIVTDDGSGITGSDILKVGKFGLRGMQERAAQLGGAVTIHGARGQGTTVIVRLPSDAGAPAPSERSVTAVGERA